MWGRLGSGSLEQERIAQRWCALCQQIVSVIMLSCTHLHAAESQHRKYPAAMLLYCSVQTMLGVCVIPSFINLR